MLSLDTNLLFYALNPDSKWHEVAEGFLVESLSEGEVVISDLVLVELYNLLRNRVVMSKPLGPKAAVEMVGQFFEYSTVIRAESAPVMDEVWERAGSRGFARRKIYDVRLGLTLRHHGVREFATANVKDFKGLGFERVWNPL